jgi:predicted HNH restriction endonuclease
VEAHHVRNLAELNRSKPAPWNTAMARRRRKTLVVCTSCHDHIHDRTPTTFKA